MKTLMTVASLLAALVFTNLASAEDAEDKKPNRFDEYHALLNQTAAVDDITLEDVEKAFAQVFLNVKSTDIATRVRASYAPEIFYNDTFKTIRTNLELAEYIPSFQKDIETSTMQIMQVMQNGPHYYILWRSTFSTKEFESDSVGMTHLQFNENKQIIFHQDFWDSTQGLYQHLPVIGQVLKFVQDF